MSEAPAMWTERDHNNEILDPRLKWVLWWVAVVILVVLARGCVGAILM